MSKNVVILGAAGRDFHTFLTFFKRNPYYRVLAFTAEQIPGIANRVFPTELAGRRYPDGIPIHPERDLPNLAARHHVDFVCLAYSDLSHQQVMEKAALAMSLGANFLLLGPRDTYVPAKKPVIAVTAVRTGCGKSQTARAIAGILRKRGRTVVGIRHSMPYGRDLRTQACQRFATADDFVAHKATIEEREEYQPWIDHGFVIYSGFDYARIVASAQRESDVLVFDGGNNDVPMVRPDLMVTVVDPHRPGHEAGYFPGLTNLLLADVVVVNKVDSAPAEAVDRVVRSVKKWNPRARVIRARSELQVSDAQLLRGKRCAVIGDGPTLSHGGMAFGAGSLAVEAHGGTIVDPRPYLVGSIRDAYARYPHLAHEIPAMGYSRRQIRELETTVNRIPCDVVVDGSPADLQRLMHIAKPVVNVGYELGKLAVNALARILTEREFV